MKREKLKDKLDEFYEIAKRYCSLVENKTLNYENLDEYIQILMELYLKSMKLPFGNDEYVSKEVKQKIENMKSDVREKIFGGGLPKTEVQDSYAQVFNPFAPEEKLDYFYISYDLCEIYEDIKEGVMLYENHKPNAAMNKWGLECNIHWGRHLISVLRPLHALRIHEEITIQ